MSQWLVHGDKAHRGQRGGLAARSMRRFRRYQVLFARAHTGSEQRVVVEDVMQKFPSAATRVLQALGTSVPGGRSGTPCWVDAPTDQERRFLVDVIRDMMPSLEMEVGEYRLVGFRALGIANPSSTYTAEELQLLAEKVHELVPDLELRG